MDTAKMDTNNREAWLTSASEILWSNLPSKAPLCVSTGFPSRNASSRSRRTVGQCWHGALTKDGRAQLYISPVLSDPVDVLATLQHEMIHAICAPKTGHRGEFRRIALASGLTGKMTATVPSPDLSSKLARLSDTLGPYPHSPLTLIAKERKGSRLRLWTCDCNIKVRVASDDFLATCGICHTPFKRS